MKNTRAGRRNSHSAAPFRRTGTALPATRAPSSTSSSTIACAIHKSNTPTSPRKVVRSGRPKPPRSRRSTLLDFGLHRLHDFRHRDLRVGLLALEVILPDRFADHELLQSENVVVDRLGALELAAHQTHERRHPVRLARIPCRVDRLVGRKLAGMDARRANDRILPD